MKKLKKEIWKKILRAHFLSLAIIATLSTLFIARSGSLTVSLAVGIGLSIATFWFTYSEYRQYIREVLAQGGREPVQEAISEHNT